MATQAVTKPDSPEDVELILRTLALNGNSPSKAKEALSTLGVDLSLDQIKYRREKHLQRFGEIQTELAGQAGERMAQKAEDLAMQALEVQALAVEKTRQQLVHGSLRDPSAAARNLATVAKEATTQAALIRGHATEIVEVRQADEIIRSLEGKLPGLKARVDAESTAQEEPT